MNYSCALTVADALRLQLIPNGFVLCGHSGLDKTIRHVKVLETPHVSRWLKGQDLVLTAGYALSDNGTAARNLIEELIGSLASAVVFRDGYHAPKLNLQAIVKADIAGLPIIQVPCCTNWTDVVEAVYSVLFHQMNQRHEVVAKISDYDEKNDAVLLKTLKTYFDYECSIKKTADELFVHPSTVKQRLKRISTIIGSPSFPRSFKEKTELYTALKFWNHQYH